MSEENIITCIKCGNIRRVSPSESDSKYCSKSCWYKDRGSKYTAWNKGIHTGIIPANKKSPKICRDCKKKKLARQIAERCQQCELARRQKEKSPTSIEKALYDYLLLKGFIFERQKLINGKFTVDAYIPSLNLVIEADGKYWHSLDRVVKKDKAENAYLTKCGFSLLRLTEEEIRNGRFKRRIS